MPMCRRINKETGGEAERGLGKELSQGGSCSRGAHCLGKYADNFRMCDTHLINRNKFLGVMPDSI